MCRGQVDGGQSSAAGGEEVGKLLNHQLLKQSLPSGVRSTQID